MSQFFSNKYLRYRQSTGDAPPVEAETIEFDLECRHCGYNLRGLPENRLCPECGGSQDDDELPGEQDSDLPHERKPLRSRPLVDAIAVAPESRRRFINLGLVLLTVCLVIVLIARVLVYLTSLNEAVESVFAMGELVVASLWAIGTWLVLPADFGRHWRWVRPARQFVLLSQSFWFIAGLCAMVAGAAGSEPMFTFMLLAMRLTAAAGAIVLIVILRHVAEEAVLEPANRRLNAAAWFLPPLTVLAMVLLSALSFSDDPISFSPWGLVRLLYRLPALIVLGVWCWMMGLLILGVWQVRQHSCWVDRAAVEAVGRAERIAAKRRALARQADSLVRDLPVTQTGEIHLEESESSQP